MSKMLTNETLFKKQKQKNKGRTNKGTSVILYLKKYIYIYIYIYIYTCIYIKYIYLFLYNVKSFIKLIIIYSCIYEHEMNDSHFGEFLDFTMRNM